jgi:hypothetical protein
MTLKGQKRPKKRPKKAKKGQKRPNTICLPLIFDAITDAVGIGANSPSIEDLSTLNF